MRILLGSMICYFALVGCGDSGSVESGGPYVQAPGETVDVSDNGSGPSLGVDQICVKPEKSSQIIITDADMKDACPELETE